MKREKFSNTCFIGANFTAYGRYEFNDRCYVDFDARKVYYNDEDMKLGESQVDLLITLISRSPELVSNEELLAKTLLKDEQGLHNVKTKLLRQLGENIEGIEIESRKKKGYVIPKLPVKIEKYPNETGKGINNIVAFLRSKRTQEQVELEEKADKISGKFLNSGADNLIGKEREDILFAMEQLSNVFNPITDVEYFGKTRVKPSKKKSVIVDMYDYIRRVCRHSEARNVLKIEGPLGSYKNRIMQYIYVMLKNEDTDILPFYIDLAYYERLAENAKKRMITEDEFVSFFEEDFAKFEEAVAAEYGRIPLLMLDGIRDFKRGNEAVYNRIGKLIEHTDCYIVACMDSDFTMNEQQRFYVHPLVHDSFEAEVKIRSMNLYKREESINFINQCLKVFNNKLKERHKAEDVYEAFLGLGFISVDAFWLISLLKECGRKLMKPGSNIYSIYESFCLSVVNDYTTLDRAAEMAYEFEYGSSRCDTDVCYDMCWRLIRKHRSILEYLIARWYIKRLDMLDVDNDSDEDFVRKLGFLNMVPQRNVTRFIAAHLKGNDGCERKIMHIAYSFYDELPWLSQCEIAFWLGRLEDPTRRRECVDHLNRFRQKALKAYKTDKFDGVARKRDAAFLLRSICISLIYENDEDAFVYYLDSLVNDKTANSINRGFHLEYYGDKPYIPNKTLLDYEDDVTKGENALTVLSISLDKKITGGDINSFSTILEVMTFCNLIQARMEVGNGVEPMDISDYLDDCRYYLKRISYTGLLDLIPDVKNYFSWMQRNLKDTKTVAPHYLSSVYNAFSGANKVKRTGWVNEKIPNPENIVEHMYNCWLVGMLYLPEEYHEPGYASYDKNTVLNMLLIHDLGETKTGDILRGEKEKDREKYDRNEREVMHDLLFTGTYPSAVGLSKYFGYWNAWDDNGAKRDINRMVAKDIDTLQTTYQFCRYYVEHPGLFSDERVRYWLEDISRMQTKIGKRIMNTLVVRNPEFADVLKNIV